MRKTLTALAIAATALAGSATLSAGNAASKLFPQGGHHMGGGQHMRGDHHIGGGNVFRHRGHHRDRDFGFFFGAPVIGSYVENDGGCYWLKRRAVRTGNPYWWDRYEACRDGY